MSVEAASASVFSARRSIDSPAIALPSDVQINARLKMDGLKLLASLPEGSIPVAFLDPQYRNGLNKMAYGNEGKSRGKTRCELPQMDNETIRRFLQGIDRALIPMGHLFLWMDKFELLNDFRAWLEGTALDVVDLVNWDKGRMGMGYRTRRTTEYCVVLQKPPRRAKGVWKTHNIPDSWREKAPRGTHPHRKPIDLQGKLLAAVSHEGDLVLDPAAGDFTVLQACRLQRRAFIGCDLNG